MMVVRVRRNEVGKCKGSGFFVCVCVLGAGIEVTMGTSG